MTSSKTRIVNCPLCGKPAKWAPDNKFRPFCSERCKLIDLGEWAQERYRIALSDSAGMPDTDHLGD